jgi:hypothetical protein
MRHALAAAVSCLLAAAVTLGPAAAASAADFEGIVDVKLTLSGQRAEQQGSGTLRLQVSAPGSRMETAMTSAMGEMKMTVLRLKARPGVSYLVNDEKRSYVEVMASTTKEDEGDAEKVTVKKLGQERVAGYDCVHAQITDEKGEKADIWITRALGGAEAFWAAQGGESHRGTRKARGTARSLRDAGLDGWPLKLRSRPESGQEMLWETTRVEKKPLPAALFSLAGYTQVAGTAGAMGQVKLSPEAQKQLDDAMRQQAEAMKQLSPEQRKQLEEMMKSLPRGEAGK